MLERSEGKLSCCVLRRVVAGNSYCLSVYIDSYYELVVASSVMVFSSLSRCVMRQTEFKPVCHAHTLLSVQLKANLRKLPCQEVV